MIKFFRRIRQSLLAEGKTVQYLKYAIGEILLVVIGILIALQINNWNQEAQARNQEFKIISDLKNEFELNEEELNKTIKVKKEALLNTQNLLRMMTRDHIPLEEIKSAISNTLGIRTYNPSGGIINTIINTGNINLIRDDELKFALSKWQDVLLNYQEEETSHLTWFIQIMEPYRNKHLPKTYRDDGNEDYLFHTEAEVEALYNLAFDDIEFQNLYLSNERYLNRALIDVKPVSQNISIILKRIDAQMNKKKIK